MSGLYDWGGLPVLTFTAYADDTELPEGKRLLSPVGQGQIRHLGKGRPAVHSNGKTLLPWRGTVAAAARKAIAEHPDPGMFPIGDDRPVALELIFTVHRPAVAVKEGRLYPTITNQTNSDRDHLERAVCDALTRAGVWGDDVQVVDGCTTKIHPGLHPAAPERPGVLVRVYQIGGINPCPE